MTDRTEWVNKALADFRERLPGNAPTRVTLYLAEGHKVTGELYQVSDGQVALSVTHWWPLRRTRFFHCHPNQIVGYTAQHIDRSGAVLD